MDPPNDNSDTKSKPSQDPPNDDGLADDLDAERKDTPLEATRRLNPLQLLLQNRQLSIENDPVHEETRIISSNEDLVTDVNCVNEHPSERVIDSGGEITSYETGDNLINLLPCDEEAHAPGEDASAINQVEDTLIDLLDDVDRADKVTPASELEPPLDPSANESEVYYPGEGESDAIQVDPMDELCTSDPPTDSTAQDYNDEDINYVSEGYVSNIDPDEQHDDITRTEDAPSFNEVDPTYNHITSTDRDEEHDHTITRIDAPSANEADTSYDHIFGTDREEEQENVTRTEGAHSVNKFDRPDTHDIEFELSNYLEKDIVGVERGDAAILDATNDLMDPPQSTTTVSLGHTEVRQRKSAGSNESQGSMPLQQMDPPEDVELGHDSQLFVPLMAKKARARATTSFQTSKVAVKQASTNLSKIQVLFPKKTTNIRLAALIIIFGVLYIAVDHFDLQSLHLENTTLSYAQFSYRLSKADLRLKKKLDDEYGSYSSLLFKSYGFTSNSLSRLRRRMMVKILYAGHLREEKSDAVVDFKWVTAGDGNAAGYGNL